MPATTSAPAKGCGINPGDQPLVSRRLQADARNTVDAYPKQDSVHEMG